MWEHTRLSTDRRGNLFLGSGNPYDHWRMGRKVRRARNRYGTFHGEKQTARGPNSSIPNEKVSQSLGQPNSSASCFIFTCTPDVNFLSCCCSQSFRGCFPGNLPVAAFPQDRRHISEFLFWLLHSHRYFIPPPPTKAYIPKHTQDHLSLLPSKTNMHEQPRKRNIMQTLLFLFPLNNNTPTSTHCCRCGFPSHRRHPEQTNPFTLHRAKDYFPDTGSI